MKSPRFTFDLSLLGTGLLLVVLVTGGMYLLGNSVGAALIESAHSNGEEAIATAFGALGGSLALLHIWRHFHEFQKRDSRYHNRNQNLYPSRLSHAWLSFFYLFSDGFAPLLSGVATYLIGSFAVSLEVQSPLLTTAVDIGGSIPVFFLTRRWVSRKFRRYFMGL
jgi:hypothetical protein